MAQTEIVNAQLQPVLSANVAGINWGQTFIGEQVFAPVDVYGEHFMYEVMGNEGLVDQGTTARGLNAESKVLSSPGSATVTADLVEYSAKMPIDYRLVNAAGVQDMIRPTPAAGMSAVDRLRLGRARMIQYNNQIQKEKAIATIAFTTTSYDAGLQANNVDFEAAGFLTTFANAKRLVAKSYGFEPDTLVLGYTAYTDLLKNADILARITGGATNSNPAMINQQLIAGILGVQRVLIGTAFTQLLSATPGTPGTATDLWTADTAALIYTGDFASADYATPAFGKLFYQNVPETGVRYAVRNWINDEGNIEWVKATEFFLAAQVMKAGYIWTNTDQA